MWRSATRRGGQARAGRLTATTLALLAAASLLLPADQALAEGSVPGSNTPPSTAPASFDTLDVTLMPEYDTPSPEVLGDLKGTLVHQGDVPITGLEVTVWVPENSQVYSVCEAGYLPGQPEHNPMAADRLTVRDGEGYQEVLWEVQRTLKPGESYIFHVEFYFDGVSGGPDKTVRYTLLPTYDSKALQLTIAEPKGTVRDSFKTALGSGDKADGGDGLTYHGYSLPGVTAGEPFDVAFSYTRPSDDPSFTPAEVSGQGSTAQGGASSGPSATATALIIGFGVLVGLAGLFLVSNRPGQGPSSRQQRRAAMHQAAKAQARAQMRTGASSSVAGPRSQPRQAPAPSAAAANPRLRARELLEEGRITQEAYQLIVEELEAEEGRRQA